MTGEIRLDTRKNQERQNGFPLKCFLHHSGSRKVITFSGQCFKLKDWDFDRQLPKTNKNDILFVRRKKTLLDDLLFQTTIGFNYSLEDMEKKLLEKDEAKAGQTELATISLYDFAQGTIDYLRSIEKEGNADIYEQTLNQFKAFRPKLNLVQVTSELLRDFKTVRQMKGNKPNTIHLYIRTFKRIYKLALKHYKIKPEEDPFEGIYEGITVKKNRTKKKNVSKQIIQVLESLELENFAERRSLDMWLLEFYLGGLDLIDLYYLKKENYVDGRIYLTRRKRGDDGIEFDIRVFDKAKVIFDRYWSEDPEYIFPWLKYKSSYATFRRNMRADLLKIQRDYNTYVNKVKKETGENLVRIFVKPTGGYLGSKVARHSFATIGRHLLIDDRIVMDIQGHEREGINSVYSDTFPEEIRDEAHKKIIY